MKHYSIIIALVLITRITALAQKENIAAVANLFINSLDKDQQLKAVFPFENEERYNFHFVPLNNRKGISINELSASQKNAALALLRSCLSSEGYRKATEIIQLEIVLKELEKRKEDDHYRDPGKYFFTVFGIPGEKTIWGWRLEGHHVAYNFSAQNNRLVAGTPGFMGSNPAVVPEGPQKGKQILADETNKGFTLLNSFSREQMKDLIMDSVAPPDILSFNSRKASFEHPAGIRWTAMSNVQQQNLLRLVEVYVHRYTKIFADEMMKEIQAAGLENLRFAWAGAREPGIGHPHYYRIHGPTIIIEYDNTQNNASHVHAVIRDLKHDFGGDELMEHYKSGH